MNSPPRSTEIAPDDTQTVGSFEAFYQREYRGVVAIARAVSPDRASAEDLTQEAFAAAHKHWDRISRYEEPRAWVRRVMINRATSMRRRLGAESRAIERAGHDPNRGIVTDLSPETLEVWSVVRRLPKRQQQAIALHYVGQLSVEEIAQVMSCSVGAVKSHLHRARQSLRQLLAEWKES